MIISFPKRKTMKFLVTVTPRRLQMPSVAAIEQSMAWIKSSKSTHKTADCSYAFMTGGGVGIFKSHFLLRN